MPRSCKVYGNMSVERDGVELELEIKGVFWPADRGSYWDPPESAYVEDAEAFLNGKSFELTDSEYEEACDALLNAAADLDDEGPEYDKYEDGC